MSRAPKIRFSFSAARRWGLRLDYALRTALVLAVVVMVNYLAARWYLRVPLSATARQPLSALTTGLLRSLTNDVRVILYYDTQDPFFTTISALLREYQNVNPRVRVSAVDPLWGPALQNVEQNHLGPEAAGQKGPEAEGGFGLPGTVKGQDQASEAGHRPSARVR